MRPLLALLVFTIILGGLQVYMMVRPHAAPLAEIPGLKAAGQISLEITLTFAAGADPFAVDADELGQPPVPVSLQTIEAVTVTDLCWWLRTPGDDGDFRRPSQSLCPKMVLSTLAKTVLIQPKRGNIL